MLGQRLENFVFKNIASKGIHYLKPVSGEDAHGLVARVYAQMRREFQVVPPMTIHSPIAELLAGVWAISRESLVAGPARRVDREAVAAAVSRLNVCPYCVEVHGMMLGGAGQAGLSQALAGDELGEIADARQAALVDWALATRTPAAPVLDAPPFAERDAPQIIGTAVAFHYINRMVNVFLDESPMPFKMGGTIKRLAGNLLSSRIVGLSPAPGDSLKLLPDCVLPSDLRWAAANPAVAGAFARMAAIAEAVGAQSLSAPVRNLVRAKIHAWNGEDMGISRAWTESALAELDPREWPAARLALLVALASYQVTAETIGDFRKTRPEDASLLGAAAWASFTAARRVGSWLSRETRQAIPR